MATAHGRRASPPAHGRRASPYLPSHAGVQEGLQFLDVGMGRVLHLEPLLEGRKEPVCGCQNGEGVAGIPGGDGANTARAACDSDSLLPLTSPLENPDGFCGQP